MPKLVTISGPPSSGKTSVILKTIAALRSSGIEVGVVKFDCLSTADGQLYERADVPVVVGLSGSLCPDHFFASNVEECLQWADRLGLRFVFVESAGLCARCSPHIRDVLAVCVIDCLAGVGTPKKIGPMLKLADVVVLTKGDIVSQAEREVMAFRTKQANPRGAVITVNGITGQGAQDLAEQVQERATETPSVRGGRLRFSMPTALCSYCLGETKLGDDYQRGYVKKMSWGDAGGIRRE